MNSASVIFLVTAIVLASASPARVRRDDRVEKYCLKHQEHYDKFCSKDSEMDRSVYSKLAKFCPAFEKHCSVDKREVEDDLVMPPPLPKSNDFAMLDLPLSEDGRRSSSSSHSRNTDTAHSSTRLTAAIIASCTPDCNAAHCTDECKCAHTHPKVHQMCNPPSSAQMAETCQHWYSKCTMFAPVQYY
ncbi:unnamed protein product [Caenorhabditis auriculariae]|uniref:Uncharacterized protein n=1 Tax=Caenorhabditis auriculariae TaxID=2777116 RepID=A0A8S1H884_9PELO|nr:unnamed protein product [Caenorhabditis auriculariae]